MATYVALLKFTEKGIQHLDQSPSRAADFKTRAKAMGIEVKDTFWLLGKHDGLLIFEAPDDETATAAMLHLGSRDFVSTQTSRAFSAAEIKSILGKIPR